MTITHNKFFGILSGLPVLVSDFRYIPVVKKYDLGVTAQLCRTAIIEAITGYGPSVKKIDKWRHLQQLGWDNQKKKLIAFYQVVLDEKVILMCGILRNNWTTEKLQKFLKALARNAEQREKILVVCVS